MDNSLLISKCALDALHKILNKHEIARDYFSLENLLLYVRRSFDSNAGIVRDVNMIYRPRETSHYLCNLEGCNLTEKTLIRMSFNLLFNDLVYIFDDCLKVWLGTTSEENIEVINQNFASVPVKLISHLWMLRFVSRDVSFLNRLPFIDSVFEAISNKTLEKLIFRWNKVYEHILILNVTVPSFSDKMYQLLMTKENLLHGSLSFREILAYMQLNYETDSVTATQNFSSKAQISQAMLKILKMHMNDSKVKGKSKLADNNSMPKCVLEEEFCGKETKASVHKKRIQKLGKINIL